DYRPRGSHLALDERLVNVSPADADDHEVTNSPAVGRQYARHGIEAVTLRGVERSDYRPRGPIPALDQGQIDVGSGDVVTNSPAVGCRDARHAGDDVVGQRGIRRGHDGPRDPVPVLD